MAELSPLTEKLRELINVFDDVRDTGASEVLDLPRVVVVGTQSAGKSSVLDAIMGMDILPKGDGVVTRRPLELRLNRLARDDDRSYAVFKNKDGKEERVDDLHQVKHIIARKTDEVAGKNSNIVDDPIVLSVYSKHCPDLTLIDLPGVTRVAVDGQSEDIEAVTRELSLKYINNPRTIILAVVAGNGDTSAADSLLLARKADKEMSRTLGVITKVDIMDKGTDCTELLLGKKFPLKLGYVAVKNRSKDDVSKCKTVQQSLVEEAAFFRKSAAYSAVMPSLLGTRSLVQKLTELFKDHARALLPGIRTEIGQKLDEIAKELAALGHEAPSDVSELRKFVRSKSKDFANKVEDCFDSKDIEELVKDGNLVDLPNRAKFRKICRETLRVLDVDDVMEDVTLDHIQDAIDSLDGDGFSGFINPEVFRFLMKPLLKRIQSPAVACVRQSSELLEALCSANAANSDFARFPKLKDCLTSVAFESIARCRAQTDDIVEKFVSATIEYIYQTGEEVIIEDEPEKEEEASTDDAKENVVEEIRKKIKDHITRVFTRTRETLPTLVGKFLIKAFLDAVDLDLLTISDAADLPELFREDEDTRMKRELLKSHKTALEKASSRIRRVFLA